MTTQTQTVDALVQLLSTGDEVDRCYSSKALGTLKAEDAVDRLIECLRDEDIDVCMDAAEALGRIGNPKAVPALVESLSNDNSGEICTAVVASLRKIGGSDVIEVLKKAASERPENIEWEDDWDTWWDIQLEAVRALGDFGGEEAVDTLTQIIDDETMQDIENDILKSLSKIPGKGVEALIERLQNQESLPQSRWRAAKALGRANSSEGIIALGRALKDTSRDVRAESIMALGNCGATKYLSALTKMLRDPDEVVRDAALKACLQLTTEETPDSDLQAELMLMMDDPSSQVRLTLYNALQDAQATLSLTEDAIDKIAASCSDKSAETASAACRLLGKIGATEKTSTLIDLLGNSDGHTMVRREAILTLGNLGIINQESVTALGRAVADKEQAVRLAALVALMELGQRGETVLTEDEEEIQRPLDIIIAAVKGDITLIDEKPATEEVDTAAEATTESDSDTIAADALSGETAQSETSDDAPEEISGRINVDPDEPFSEKVASTIILPESPTRIVEEGEVRTAMSTLDAIAMDNVEATLGLNNIEQQEPEHDEETTEYLEVVEENKEEMKRIRHKKRISPAQDVRRLGAKVLSESEDKGAVEALIQALNDDDEILRQEAAAAIGEIGRKRLDMPELMDAVGTLITQLTVGGVEQRGICARALAHLGNRAAVKPLVEALKDSETTVRVLAIEALSNLINNGRDPSEADHMVIADIPNTSIAKKITEQLKDEDSGIRVTAAKALAESLPNLTDKTFVGGLPAAIVDSVSMGGGEEARTIGKVLQAFDRQSTTETLLSRLDQAEDSVKRSIYIEMLEELLQPHQDQPQQAA
ncbi:MAG: HEAT repeat domain-containing protein [Candidatus Sedimenticola sp. (ex Thyasira tokunagai)]